MRPHDEIHRSGGARSRCDGISARVGNCRRGLDGISRAQAASVTRQLFVVTLWACIAWISCSYAMAIYSMVILGQVYTLTELSEPALKALTVTLGGKVLSNIFEHNNNKFFGTSVGSTDTEGGI